MSRFVVTLRKVHLVFGDFENAHGGFLCQTGTERSTIILQNLGKKPHHYFMKYEIVLSN